MSFWRLLPQFALLMQQQTKGIDRFESIVHGRARAVKTVANTCLRYQHKAWLASRGMVGCCGDESQYAPCSSWIRWSGRCQSRRPCSRGFRAHLRCPTIQQIRFGAAPQFCRCGRHLKRNKSTVPGRFTPYWTVMTYSCRYWCIRVWPRHCPCLPPCRHFLNSQDCVRPTALSREVAFGLINANPPISTYAVVWRRSRRGKCRSLSML